MGQTPVLCLPHPGSAWAVWSSALRCSCLQSDGLHVCRATGQAVLSWRGALHPLWSCGGIRWDYKSLCRASFSRCLSTGASQGTEEISLALWTSPSLAGISQPVLADQYIPYLPLFSFHRFSKERTAGMGWEACPCSTCRDTLHLATAEELSTLPMN